MNVDHLPLDERLRVGVRTETQHAYVLSRAQYTAGNCPERNCSAALVSRNGLRGHPARMRMEVRGLIGSNVHRRILSMAQCTRQHGLKGYCYVNNNAGLGISIIGSGVGIRTTTGNGTSTTGLNLRYLHQLSRGEVDRQDERTDTEQDLVLVSWLPLNGNAKELSDGFNSVMARAEARYNLPPTL